MVLGNELEVDGNDRKLGAAPYFDAVVSSISNRGNGNLLEF